LAEKQYKKIVDYANYLEIQKNKLVMNIMFKHAILKNTDKRIQTTETSIKESYYSMIRRLSTIKSRISKRLKRFEANKKLNETTININ